jgi:predicted RNA polymerase sigma factor
VPDNPVGWLVTVATRRLTDEMRSDAARRRREDLFAATSPGGSATDVDERSVSEHDDALTLLFMCCHPSLSPSSQIALTLRAIGGLTTAEIARAFLVPETTMAQRISRAKQSVRESGGQFTLPPVSERGERLKAVLQVLYLIFNEGYTTTAGVALARSDLTDEAIRLIRLVRSVLPEDGEVSGLLALMLLTDARRHARSRADGSLVPMSEQDRSLWDKQLIDEGVALVTLALSGSRLGPYQLQAAIAAVHDEAGTVEQTDWAEILGLYRLLEVVSPNPMVTLNRAVAVAMVEGPDPGLKVVADLESDARMARNHRLHAVRAHLLEMKGDDAAARASYKVAARLATNVPEKRYLEVRAGALEPRTEE